MIKIFSQNKIIYLINDRNVYRPNQECMIYNIRTKKEIQLKYNELITKNDIKEIWFYNENKNNLFEYFSAMFHIISAAGGLVKNKNNEWLFIFRNGKWDLPKGKIEKGEAIKTAAIREVEEECGINGLTILKELPPTYHTYSIEEKAILKPTYWFEMFCSDESKLIPQTEEGITDVKWLSVGELKQVDENTYDSVKEVMKEIKNEK